MEFQDIALAKFLQAAPKLGPLIQNFSEITDSISESESQTRVGVFILRAGGSVVTVPVISKGDNVLPVDSIFLEDEAQFRPLTNATIEYVISKTSNSIGKAKKLPDSAVKNPNLQHLVVPPRTGKFVYASASRLTEFLAVLPPHLKKFTFEKISSEQSTYDILDRLFGLKTIFQALNGNGGGSGPVNSVSTGGPVLTDGHGPYSVITSPQEIKALMNDTLSKSFLEKGYVITGGGNPFRAAVAQQPYNTNGVYTSVSPAIDSDKEFEIVMRGGASQRAYLPKFHVLNSVPAASLISLFEDGSYARGSLITNGIPTTEMSVLDTLFKGNPPKLLRDLIVGNEFLLFTSSGEALGPFSANAIARTAHGVEVKTYSGGITKIYGYTNFTRDIDKTKEVLFVPGNIIVYVLGKDVGDLVETSINTALANKDIITSQYLNSEIDIRHDGVEFSANGSTIGDFPSALKRLVEVEHLEPDSASNFLKQAEVTKFLKIFLSKKASENTSNGTNPAPIASFGLPPPKVPDVGLNGSFMPAVRDAAQLNDSQALESTIIAQLLQVPELFEYISEYLPDIEATTDRLGRILFLSRLKVEQLSDSLDSDSVFAMINSIKNVYRQLGDIVLKFKSATSVDQGFERGKTVRQTNGK